MPSRPSRDGLGQWEDGASEPDVAHEVFAREEYPERTRLGDYTLPVIITSKKQQEAP